MIQQEKHAVREDTRKNKQRQTNETKGSRTKYKAHETRVYQK